MSAMASSGRTADEQPSDSPSSKPPGWHPDPEPGHKGAERFWDGAAWTDRVRLWDGKSWMETRRPIGGDYADLRPGKGPVILLSVLLLVVLLSLLVLAVGEATLKQIIGGM
jgi:hypothetical protein